MDYNAGDSRPKSEGWSDHEVELSAADTGNITVNRCIIPCIHWQNLLLNTMQKKTGRCILWRMSAGIAWILRERLRDI